MATPGALSAAFVVAVSFPLVLAGCASADPCERFRMPPPSTISLGLGPADFGTTPRACARTGGRIEGRGALLIDRPDFYGAITAQAVLAGEYAIDERLWLSGALELLTYRWATNATIEASQVDLGPTTIGAHLAVVRTRRLRIAPFARLLLPTETSYRFALRAGVEPGVAALFRPRPRTTLHAGVSLPATVTLLGGNALITFTPRLSLEAAFTPWHGVEGALGLEVRLGTDPAGALEMIAPSLELRFYPWQRLYVRVALLAPLAGLERTDYRAALSIGW